MSFFSQKRVGELNSRISNDIQIQDTPPLLLQSSCAVYLGSFIMLASINIVNHYDGFCGAASRCCSSSLVGIYENILKKVQDQVAESQVVVEETMQGIKHS
jgi:hypothetical protein